MFSLKVFLWNAALCLVVLLTLTPASESGPMDLEGPSALRGLVTGGKSKRLFDASCKGIYDRELFMQLDRVCEDCYNLYRKAHVATECRRNCYNSPVFEGCLKDLMMHDVMGDYKEMALMVAGKK